ncbi:hypothetical protein YC2023_110458 [Brassica napus]
MDMMRCSLVSLSVMILQWRDLESCFLCLDLVIILGLLLSLVFKKRNSRLPSPISGMGIWVTTKAEPNELLWSTSLKLIWKLFPCYQYQVREEYYNAAYIIGENGFFKTVDLGRTDTPHYFFGPFVCSNSYVPSLVQIKQKEREEE